MTRILSILNRQRVRAVDTNLLRRLLAATLQDHLHVAAHELGLHLVTATEMAVINETFLGHPGSTDVITFDHSDPPAEPPTAPQEPRPVHGEIFISIPDAIRQARQFRTTWQAELVRYAIHGILHLMGHDDLKPGARRAMKRTENRLVAEVSAAFPISRLARPARPARSAGPTRPTRTTRSARPARARGGTLPGPKPGRRRIGAPHRRYRRYRR